MCNRKGDLYQKKIRPPKSNTWAGEDGRAKGGGWLKLRKEILLYNLFHVSLLLLG